MSMGYRFVFTPQLSIKQRAQWATPASLDGMQVRKVSQQTAFSIQATATSTHCRALINNQTLHPLMGLFITSSHKYTIGHVIRLACQRLVGGTQCQRAVKMRVQYHSRNGISPWWKRLLFIIQLSEGRLTNWITELTNAVPNCKDTPSIHRQGTTSAVRQAF